MRVSIFTLGCKVNQTESNGIIEKFKINGFEVGSFSEDNDIFIINSCAVTEEAGRKSRVALKKTRKRCPQSIIVFCGCLPQVDGGDFSKYADIVCGARDKNKIYQRVCEFLQTKKPIFDISEDDTAFDMLEHGISNEKTRAFVKIEDGCDHHCAYCVIGRARGAVRSKAPEYVKEELISLAKTGFKEIVFVGINLASYGKGEDFDLCDVLSIADKVDGIERIRLGSMEPDLISEKFIEAFKNSKKLMPHFHISLQSGCDETLKRMGRRYSSKDYFELITKLKQIKNATITTDVLVGFPGETEEEFNKTKEFVTKCRFLFMHCFSYSKRPNTPAAVMENQVSKEEKFRRHKEIDEINKANNNKILDAQIGKTLSVLIERDGEGHSENYITVKIEKNLQNAFSNEIKNVKITKRENNVLIGEV